MKPKMFPVIKERHTSLLLLSTSLFILICLAVLLTINHEKFDVGMVILSIFLFFILTYTISIEDNKFSPLIFFSLLFYGYVFSGLYFSYYSNIETAKFFNFSGNFTTVDIKHSILKVIVGYLFFVVGYKLSNFVSVIKVNLDVNNALPRTYITKLLVIFLFFSSFFYWVYVSFLLANGPYGLLKNMGQYHLLLQSNYISTAPYILAYISTSVLYLISLEESGKIRNYVKLMIALSFIMYVSTGRLSGAVIYLVTFLLMYLIYNKINLNAKVLSLCVCFVFLLGGLYFYRLYSNLSYLGMEFEGDIVGLVGEHFFGMTNFGDLQSIAFASQYTKDLDYLYGSSLLDFLDFWIGRVTGIEVYITSVGTRLTDFYFSDYDSGSPAPGIISEVIVNFGLVGLTLFMLLIGFLCGMLYKSIYLTSNLFNVYVLANYLVFILLLAKVDSTHINSFIWAIAPFYILSIFLKAKSFLFLGRVSA